MPFIGNQPALSFTSFAKQDFSTSATTSYTLDNPVTNANELALFINFVRQEPTTAYSASGTSLTLTSATASSDDMYCVYLGKAVQTVNPPNASVGTSQLVDGSVTSAKINSSVGLGITSAQEFRLAANQAGSNSAGTVLTNWEENDTEYQAIGSNWSQSSGIFSCSATGIYSLAWLLNIAGASGNDAFDSCIEISTDSGSSYTSRAKSWGYVTSSPYAAAVGNTFIFKVANTSTFRLRFKESATNEVANTSTIRGSSTESLTNMTFVRLGDI